MGSITNELKEMRLREQIFGREDLAGCVALYLDLFEDTDVMHRDVVEEEIQELRYGDEENCMEADRLELMLRDNPAVTYFDYYNEKPITFEWLEERLALNDTSEDDGATAPTAPWISLTRGSMATDEDWERVCEMANALPDETGKVTLYLLGAEAEPKGEDDDE